MSTRAAGDDVPQLPLMEAAKHDAEVEIRPTWRGWIHAATFPVAIVAGIVLIVLGLLIGPGGVSIFKR